MARTFKLTTTTAASDMPMVRHLSLWGSIVTTLIVSVVVVEARYMLEVEASQIHEKLEEKIETKASKQNVSEFRAIYIEAEIDELKFRRFQITKKETLTPDDEYSIQQIDSRIDKMERKRLIQL